MNIRSRSAFRFGFVASALVSIGLFGCGKAGPKTHTIKGRVKIQGRQPQVLAGSLVEGFQPTDPNIRVSGVIQEDGQFSLETLHQGTTLQGAKEGTYQARLILTEDDPGVRRVAQGTIDPRYFRFDTAGLSFEIPSEEEIVLRVTPR